MPLGPRAHDVPVVKGRCIRRGVAAEWLGNLVAMTEVACKSCVHFRTGNVPWCERWPEAATVAPSGQISSDMGITGGGPIPSGALVRASGTPGLAGASLPVQLEGWH